MRNNLIIFIFVCLLLIVSVKADNYIVSGQINKTMELRPFFYVGNSSLAESSFGNYSLVFYNNSLILKYFNFSSYYEYNRESFSFIVNIPNNTNSIRFMNKTGIMKIFNISRNIPSITKLNVSSIGNMVYNVSWIVNDTDRDNLTYSVYYARNNGSWDFLSLDQTENFLVVNLSSFPGGNYSFKLIACDGFNFKEKVYYQNFSVSDKSPYVHITYPNYNSVFSQGEISFLGFADDPEGQLGNLNWYSDIDGFLGIGEYITYDLSLGQHTIKLEVSDSVSVVNDSVVIYVVEETNPDVSIYNISSNYLVEGGYNYLITTLYNIIQDAYVNVSFYDGVPSSGNLIDSYNVYAYANTYTDVYAFWRYARAGMHNIYVKVSDSVPGESSTANNEANVSMQVNVNNNKTNFTGKILLRKNESVNNSDDVVIQLRNNINMNVTSFNLKINFSGYFVINNILIGWYDIWIKPKYWLASMNESINIEWGSFHFGRARVGDYKEDNSVNARDAAIFSGAYGTNCTHPYYKWYVDFDGNCKIDFFDLPVFSSNYGSYGAANFTSY